MLNFDLDFITSEEGRVLKGYVPKRNGQVIGKSGVTIGVGFDIGQRTTQEIKAYNITEALKYKLLPYCEKRQIEAVKVLEQKPLTISAAECDELTRAIIEHDLETTKRLYDRDAKEKFDTLPREAQTVIASLAWNFGAHLNRSLPITWGLCVRRDWKRLYARLLDFPSKQPELDKRRKREAALIEAIL